MKSPPCPPGRCSPVPKVSKKPASHRAHPHSPAPTPPIHQAAHAVHSSELWFLSKVLSGRRPFLGQHRGLSRWDLHLPRATSRSNTLHLTEATMTLPPPPEGPAFAQAVPCPGGPSRPQQGRPEAAKWGNMQSWAEAGEDGGRPSCPGWGPWLPRGQMTSHTGARCGLLPPRVGPKLAGQSKSAARAQGDMSLVPLGTKLGQGEEGGTC